MSPPRHRLLLGLVAVAALVAVAILTAEPDYGDERHPAFELEDWQRPPLAFVGAIKSGDVGEAEEHSCAEAVGKYPVRPLLLRSPDGTEITTITRFQVGGGTSGMYPDPGGQSLSGSVGVRVFGPQADGREGGLVWEFNVRQENGEYVVCGSRTSKLDHDSLLKH